MSDVCGELKPFLKNFNECHTLKRAPLPQEALFNLG